MKFVNLTESIGSTPIVKLKGEHNIFAKLEFFNPLSSVKDRVALALINDAVEKGILTKDKIIVEPTSGNTGIGLTAIAKNMGYDIAIVMPESMSQERRGVMSWLGAELILTDASLGMKGAIEKANELERSGKYVQMGQFTNPANAHAHYTSTGPEIWEDMEGNVDILVCGVGTGGTITGVGKYLKEKNKSIKIIAVEPEESAVLSHEPSGAHGVQGIGAGFIPEILDVNLIDEIERVSTKNAIKTAKNMAEENGLFVGISAGAAAFAAINVAKRAENRDKNIVVIFPDSGDRYISVFNEYL